MQTASEVLRAAATGRLGRARRRELLAALEALPLETNLIEMRRNRSAWQRLGEKLHPFEHASRFPNTALAFAVVRRSRLSTLTIGDSLRERAVQAPFLYVEDDQVHAIAWAGPIEDALRSGNPRSALARLTHRPSELLRRADHLVRLAQVRQLDALQTMLKAVELAAVRAPAELCLAVAGHLARRGRPWPRRVFAPHGNVLAAWGTTDTRVALRSDCIAVMVGAIRRQLVARADVLSQFPRAVIDRALVDLIVPGPSGNDVTIPPGATMRVTGDAPLVCALFDSRWMYREQLDGEPVLHFEELAMHRARFALVVAPPRARHVEIVGGMRVDLRGGARDTVALAIDLGERRARWTDIAIPARTQPAQLAHLGRDLTDLHGMHARPTLWDVACIHAAARAT